MHDSKCHIYFQCMLALDFYEETIKADSLYKGRGFCELDPLVTTEHGEPLGPLVSQKEH